MSAIRVYKLDEHGQEVLHYDGEVVARGANWVCLRAIFTYGERNLDYFVMRVGDVFNEWFYSDRWYNIFRVEDGQTGELKGFYCNITRPAEITTTAVRSDDLALDVIVETDGSIHLQDEDEFAALDLSRADREAALAGVAALRRHVAEGTAPFDDLR